MSKKLVEEFTSTILKERNRKTFGYFLSNEKNGDPVEFIVFNNNTRENLNFEEINEYYVDNETAGFYADPLENYRIEKAIQAKNMYIVGVFHCHMRHPAIFALIDQKYHPTKRIWHLIISIRNSNYPRLSVYYFNQEGKAQEAKLIIEEYSSYGDEDRIKCRKLIEDTLVPIKGATFDMGTEKNDKFNFIGEEPKHVVTLGEYSISNIPVTCEMYGLFDKNYTYEDKMKPVTNITWLQAKEFCEWAGYKLPTEAQWEYACRGGVDDGYFCSSNELKDFCWYSDNSKSVLHSVAERKPNPYNLYDMIGNIWEWCEDFYDEFYYERSEKLNPINEMDTGLKVCRGGSYFSFEEMVRHNFRWKEPIDYSAGDIGFRVVCDNRIKK